MSTQNPLDKYDLVTYNFELYIVEPIGDAMSLLAKTANSPYFIDDVNIKSVVTPNTRTGTTLAVEFAFAVKEPNGAYFLQHLQEKAIELGVHNYLKTDFFLRLNFSASHQGRFLENVVPPLEWRVVMTDCDVNIDSSGTTYNFKAVTNNQYASSNQYGMVTEAVSIEAENINEFFGQLSGQLKEMKRHAAAAHSSVEDGIDEYEFIFSEAVIGDGKLVTDNPQQEMSSMNDAVYDEQSWDKEAIHITENIEIPRVIDMAITSTEHFQRMVKKSQAPDSNERKDYEPKDFYIIVPSVKHEDYDTGRHDYVRKFTYEVKPYKKVTSKVQPGEESDEEVSPSPLKSYQYIFTGKNIDVINLDVNFNFSGVIPMTNQSGVTTNTSSSIAGARMSPEEKNEDLQVCVEQRDDEYGIPTDASYVLGDIINTYVIDNQSHHSDYAFPAARHEGRKMASTYWRDSLMDRKENMLNIDLEIRGDPDWMRETKEENIEGDIYFDLKIKSPRPSDIEGDWINAKDMLILKGKYQLIELESNFSNGMFTQKLSAIRNTRQDQ